MDSYSLAPVICDCELIVLHNCAGKYLSNLTSDLPPLRPLSVATLLLLLQPGPHKVSPAQNPRTNVLSAEKIVTSTVTEGDFAEKVVSNLGFDHTFAEGGGR